MENKKPWLKPIHMLAQAMKKNKKLELAVYGVLLALSAILALSMVNTGKDSNTAQQNVQQSSGEVAQGERQVEERLEEILSCIRGAGKVRVMLIYDTSVEIVPAMSVDTQTSTSETVNDSGQTVNQNQSEKKTPVTVSGEDGALVLTQKQPEIRGVIVVAEGAADISVRLNLLNAVQTVLNVDAEDISVFEMTITDWS
ncbi:MAG TPA: hypothetical protein VN608_05485 [Clostridia bacterium]|nr:hypothetical protein [Clostridia bacterium]